MSQVNDGERIEEKKIFKQKKFNFQNLSINTELLSNSTVVMPMRTPQNMELRISRTRTNTFRDSHLQLTERKTNRENAKYNPDCNVSMNNLV